MSRRSRSEASTRRCWARWTNPYPWRPILPAIEARAIAVSVPDLRGRATARSAQAAEGIPMHACRARRLRAVFGAVPSPGLDAIADESFREDRSKPGSGGSRTRAVSTPGQGGGKSRFR